MSVDSRACTADVAGMFIVLGRVLGDEKDTVKVVEALSEKEADAVFTRTLQADCGGDETTDVWVISCVPVTDAIACRLVAPAKSMH